MTRISTLELRRGIRAVLERVRRGERLVLTYRGRPFARLEPYAERPEGDDPFYGLAERAAESVGSLTNAEIDGTVYGA